MFCRYCGNKLPDEALFCNQCGNKVVLEEKVTVVENEIVEQEETIVEVIDNMQQSNEELNQDIVDHIEENTTIDKDVIVDISSTNETEVKSIAQEVKEDTSNTSDKDYYVDLKGLNRYRDWILTPCALIVVGAFFIFCFEFGSSIYEDIQNGVLFKLIVYIVRFLVRASYYGLIAFIPLTLFSLLSTEKKDIKKGVKPSFVYGFYIINAILLYLIFTNIYNANEIQQLGVFALAMSNNILDQIKGLFEIFDTSFVLIIIWFVVAGYYTNKTMPNDEK